MSLWRRTRNEVAGAWRSLRYDLGRSPAGGAAGPRPSPGPDVTCTGMSTFDGAVVASPRHAYDEYDRPRCRLVAVGAFVALALAGAAGSYLAVVFGLGTLLDEEPVAAGQPPVIAVAPPAPPTPAADQDDELDATSGLGRGPADVVARPATVAVPPRKSAAPAAGSGAGATPPARPTPARPAPPAQPPRPGTPPSEDCDCLSPPVPTPTAPASSPEPSPTPSVSPSPAESEPSGSPEPSPKPSGSQQASFQHRPGP